MPPPDECVMHWITRNAVEIKWLFEAIKHIVSEGRLMFNKHDIFFVAQQDIFKHTTISALLEVPPASQYILKGHSSLFVPINLDSWSTAMFSIRKGHTLGMCITKESQASNQPHIDLYVNPGDKQSCSIAKCNWLIEEYAYFGNAPTHFTTPGNKLQAVILSPQLRHILNQAQRFSDMFTLTFYPRRTILTPVTKPSQGTTFAYRIELPDTQEENKMPPGVMSITTEAYQITSVFATTKAAKLAKEVLIAYTIPTTHSPGWEKKAPLQLTYEITFPHHATGHLRYSVLPGATAYDSMRTAKQRPNKRKKTVQFAPRFRKRK